MLTESTLKYDMHSATVEYPRNPVLCKTVTLTALHRPSGTRVQYCTDDTVAMNVCAQRVPGHYNELKIQI